jgi:hypothetical protein
MMFVLMTHLRSESSSVHAATFTVCSVGCDFSAIQAAVDSAMDGDVIKVAAGTYTDINVRPRSDITNTGFVTQVVYISKSITIQGGYTTAFIEPPNPDTNLTKLDAQGQGRVIYITGEVNPTVEGVYITQGNATGLGGDTSWNATNTDAGGGIYIVSGTATISNVVLFKNSGGVGGGIYLRNNSTVIENNSIFSNTTTHSGGGIYVDSSAPIINHNVISANIASHSGGGSSLVNNQGLFSDNAVISNTAGYAGGGLILGNSETILKGNNIVDNQAGGPGGGLLLTQSSVTLNRNTIRRNISGVDNTFGGNGGGLFLTNSNPLLSNNIIADNEIIGDTIFDQGSAIYIRASSPRLLHTTIARNIGYGGGIFIDDDPTPSTVVLTNTIFVSHTVGISVSAGHTAKLESTLWGTESWANGVNTSGLGVIVQNNDYVGNPMFVNFTSGDYHLMNGSDAINKGITAGVIVDIDGENRNTPPDLGADEYVGSYNSQTYLPVITKD